MAEDKIENLVEIRVTRAAGDLCWELVRPSNGRRMASPNKALVAEEVLREVTRAGGRAVVVYDDQNKLVDRVQRQRGHVTNSIVAGNVTGTIIQRGDYHGDLPL